MFETLLNPVERGGKPIPLLCIGCTRMRHSFTTGSFYSRHAACKIYARGNRCRGNLEVETTTTNTSKSTFLQKNKIFSRSLRQQNEGQGTFQWFCSLHFSFDLVWTQSNGHWSRNNESWTSWWWFWWSIFKYTIIVTIGNDLTVRKVTERCTEMS